jgi:hypothetical protein
MEGRFGEVPEQKVPESKEANRKMRSAQSNLQVA